jgi:L-lactate permease
MQLLKDKSAKGSGHLIEMMVEIFIACALVPTILWEILNTNMTGIYKTLWSVLAIVVIAVVLYGLLKKGGMKAGR